MIRRRRGGWLTPLMVVVALLALLDQFARSAVEVAVPDYARDQPFAEDLDVAVRDLRTRGPRAAADGWLDVLHSGRQVAAADVLRIAGARGQPSAFFTYDIDGRDRATASAMVELFREDDVLVRAVHTRRSSMEQAARRISPSDEHG